MSAPQIRPARARGPQQRSSRIQDSPPTPDPAPIPPQTVASTAQSNDSHETRALRRKYSDKLTTLKELFPNWTEEDILSVLSDVNGSVEVAVGRISEGHAEQWGSVTRKKDKKASAAPAPSSASFSRENHKDRDFASRGSSRGGGGRGGGPAGRGGRGGSRGGRQPREHQQNGYDSTTRTGASVVEAGGVPASKPPTSVDGVTAKTYAGPVTTSAAEAWGEPTVAATPTGEPSTGADWVTEPVSKAELNGAYDTAETQVAIPATVQVPVPKPAPSSRVPAGSKLSWAQVTRPKEVPKPVPTPPAPVLPPPVLALPPTSTVEPTRHPTPPPEEWEDPTTAQPVAWDDDPAQVGWTASQSTHPASEQPSSHPTEASTQQKVQDPWQDPAIVSISSHPPPSQPLATSHDIDTPSSESESAPTPTVTDTSTSATTSVTSTSTANTIGSSTATTTSNSPPPGLPTPTASKPSTPSAKSVASVRAARYKSSDQPVIMPSGSSVPPFAYPGAGTTSGGQQLNFGGNYSFDRFGMQFGSLNMDEDSEASLKEPAEPTPDAVPSAASQQTPQQSPVQTHQQQIAQAAQQAQAQAQAQVQAQAQQAQLPSQSQVQQQQHESSQLPSSLPSQLTQQQSQPLQAQQSQPQQPQLNQQQQQASVASLYQPTSHQQASGHHLGAQAAPSHYSSIPPSLPHHQSQPQPQPQPAQPQQAQHAGYAQQHIQAAQPQQQHAIDSRLGHPLAHTSYYRGPEQTYYSSPNALPSSQPPQQQDLTSQYGEFSPLGQAHASHLGAFNSNAAPVDYLYGDQQRASYYDSYGQGGSAFQGRNGSISHDEVNKGLLPSQLQTSSGLQQQSAPAQAQGQSGPPLAPAQGAQPPPAGQGQPGYPGLPPISYYYPQPYSQTPYYGQYGGYPPPQPQYMKYQAVYHNAPGSSPAPPQQQPNKPPPNAVAPANSPYGTAQTQHLYHPSQAQSYDEYGQSNASIVDPYGKQQVQQQQLYGAQNIGSFLGLPGGGVQGAGTGSAPGGQQQSANQQQRGGSGSSPESAYKPYGSTSTGSNGAGAQDKVQQGQQGQAGRGNVTAPGVGGPQGQGQAQQGGAGYFPNRYSQQPAQTGARSYGPPDQTQYYQQYTPQYWQ